MYNPSADCGDETHTRLELYEKLTARNQHLGQDREKYPHVLPDESGHYNTLFGDYKPDSDQERVDEEMKRVKLLKRPAFDLENWSYSKYYEKFDELREGWLKEVNQIDHDHIHNTTPQNGILSIDRFHYKDVSYEWFVKNYEKIAEPCMISGFTDEWPLHQWTIGTMSRSFLREENVKVGKDHNGRRIGLPFNLYAQYLYDTRDDSPVYLFESQIDRNNNICRIFDSYRPPVWFGKDLLNYCHPERRPPHRWFCIGKKGSGTTMHLDPLGLLAWNSVIAGRKLWIIFDKCTPDDLATGKVFMKRPPSGPVNPFTEAVGWFHLVWPQMKQFLMGNKVTEKYKPRVLIQYPGETIFVPGGLYHFVLNLDDSLAVTQNYCNMSNFGLCWREMRVERRHTAIRWLEMLKRRFPLAFKFAKQLDEQDNFTITLKKPHINGEHNIYIKSLKDKKLNGEELTPEELDAIVQYDQNHDQNKQWGETEAPFEYSPEWKYWSGSTDSSTDSEESESSGDDDDDGDDSEDETSQDEKME
jgi:histone arginine demethylase JMJD6